MGDALLAASDRFGTVCMDILANVEDDPSATLTVTELGAFIQATSDLLRAQNERLAESFATGFELRDAWYTLADEIGIRRDGHLPD